MKRIGYIYYYSEVLCKGIICFGNLNDVSIFDKKDCITTIIEKSLVFFELEDSRISNIETASFSNFDLKLVKSYFSKPYITFINPDLAVSCEADYDEYGNEIGVPEKNTQEYLERTLKRISGESVFDFLDDIKTIDTIDIFNFALWVENYTSKKNYGIKSNDFFELYQIFEVRVKENIERQNKNREWHNKLSYEISPLWKVVLGDMEEKDLDIVFEKYPEIQPFLPIPYAQKNVDMLSESIEFPSKSICAKYYSSRIKENSSVSFYLNCIEKLNIGNDKEKRFVLENLPSIQKRKIYKLLEENLHSSLIPNIIVQVKQILRDISHDMNTLNYLSLNVEETIKIGDFFEKMEEIKEFRFYYNSLYRNIIESFNALDKSSKILFSSYLSLSFENWFLSIIFNPDATLYDCNTAYIDLKEHLSSDFNKRIKDNIISSKLSGSSFDETLNAFHLGIINESICLNRIKELLCDKPVEYFFYYFNRFKLSMDLPLFIQEFLLFKIIDLFNFKDSSTFNWIPETIGVERCKAICFSAETLVNWIKDNSSSMFDDKSLIDKDIATKAINRLNNSLLNDGESSKQQPNYKEI